MKGITTFQSTDACISRALHVYSEMQAYGLLRSHCPSFHLKCDLKNNTLKLLKFMKNIKKKKKKKVFKQVTCIDWSKNSFHNKSTLSICVCVWPPFSPEQNSSTSQMAYSLFFQCTIFQNLCINGVLWEL